MRPRHNRILYTGAGAISRFRKGWSGRQCPAAAFPAIESRAAFFSDGSVRFLNPPERPVVK